jgi:serine/threonine-protein kinase PknG
LAAALAEQGAYAEAEELLKALAAEDAWDWRVLWYQGRMKLAQDQPVEARKLFDQVYFDLPGELAPKLALGLAAELAGDYAVALKMYDLVIRTDPAFVSAAFGLARCHFANRGRKAAVAALERIPPSSALFARARIEAARMLVRTEHGAPHLEDLAAASTLLETLALEGMDKCVMTNQILTSALEQVGKHSNSATRILGKPFDETSLRTGLEESLRTMARLVPPAERIRLVDEANRVRPRTLF